MASIEVSLSTAPRRKNAKKVSNGSLSGSTKPSTPVQRSGNLVDSCRELEMLRHALRDKENTIQNLQGQVLCPPRPLDPGERRTAEIRLQSLRLEEEMRRGNIARVSDLLSKMDANENNIDVRIRQAELEYELGREELALLGVREEKRTLQGRLEAKPSSTLYSCVQPVGRLILLSVSIECDPKSPRFGAGTSEDNPGLVVLWATEDSGLRKGDRILEVNGKLTLSTTREELSRLLSVCPARAELVVCRIYCPPTSPDDVLRRENLRLTHRISYLEDQVTELLNFKEKALTPQVEVFQKGSQVTVISSPESSRNSKHNLGDLQSDSDGSAWKFGKAHSSDVGPSQQYQDSDGYKGSVGDKIRALNRRYESDERIKTSAEDRNEKVPTISTVYIHPAKSSPNVHSLPQSERSTRRNKEEARIVDYSSETACPRYRSHRDRSVKSLDLDADTSGADTITRRQKPAPPRKPLRLSMQRATSLQSMELPCSSSGTRRSRHKAVAPQPPAIESATIDLHSHGFHWPGQFHRNRSKGRTVHVGEKWC